MSLIRAPQSELILGKVTSWLATFAVMPSSIFAEIGELDNEGNGEIVDVVVDTESLLEDEIDNYVDKSYDDDLEDIAPTFRTKRSTIEKVP